MSELTDFLTGIADAIRAKKGITGLIPAAKFAEEISSISGGGSGGEELVLTDLTVSENGVYVPGEGVDGFKSVTVSVAPGNGIVVNAVDADGNWTDITIYGDVPDRLFYGDAANSTLRRVEFRNTTSIGDYAFRNCSALTSVDIPATVESVGTGAFYNCSALTTVYWNPPAISSIGLTTYPAFGSCSALTNFIIADNVTVLPSYMLQGCTGIVNIEIPESVTTIGARAFYGCSNLASVTVPAAVTSVGIAAFYNCKALTTVHWNAPAISTVGNASYPIFYGCSSLTDFVIADNVTIVPSYLLRGCSGIVSIVIPNSVSSIGTQAFYNCTALVSVQIGSTEECSISSIATNAFTSCAALTSITIYKSASAVSGSPWGATNATVTWAS